MELNNLTTLESKVLSFICSSPFGVSEKDVIKHLGIDKPALIHAIQRLTDNGFKIEGGTWIRLIADCDSYSNLARLMDKYFPRNRGDYFGDRGK